MLNSRVYVPRFCPFFNDRPLLLVLAACWFLFPPGEEQTTCRMTTLPPPTPPLVESHLTTYLVVVAVHAFHTLTTTPATTTPHHPLHTLPLCRFHLVTLCSLPCAAHTPLFLQCVHTFVLPHLLFSPHFVILFSRVTQIRDLPVVTPCWVVLRLT